MYKIMTAGPVQVRENVLAARSIPCTNPDQDVEFYEFYKETCDLFSEALHTESRAIIMAMVWWSGGTTMGRLPEKSADAFNVRWAPFTPIPRTNP